MYSIHIFLKERSGLLLYDIFRQGILASITYRNIRFFSHSTQIIISRYWNLVYKLSAPIMSSGKSPLTTTCLHLRFPIDVPQLLPLVLEQLDILESPELPLYFENNYVGFSLPGAVYVELLSYTYKESLLLSALWNISYYNPGLNLV